MKFISVTDMNSKDTILLNLSQITSIEHFTTASGAKTGSVIHTAGNETPVFVRETVEDFLNLIRAGELDGIIS